VARVRRYVIHNFFLPPPPPMAKSLRSKVKRAFRAKKREDGVYAATHAARLQRLHARIHAIATGPKPVHDVILEDVEDAEGDGQTQEEIAGEYQSQRLSLSGRILSGVADR
jgi:hypothetical protein